MRRPARINGLVAGGVALAWMVLAAHSPVSADTRTSFSRTTRHASSRGTTLSVGHRRFYGPGGHRSHHYSLGSRYDTAYQPSYYGSSYHYGYRPIFGFHYYSYRPGYYGYSYARPYYFSYSYPRSVYGVYRPLSSPYRSHSGYRFGRYDYGGYCCPPPICCSPCEPAPAGAQKPSGVQESPKPQPTPQPESELPPVPPKADGPSL